MNANQLHTLFNPRSIAVIGASDTPGRVGYALFKNLTTYNFSGTVYPVNPNRETVQGVKAYPDIAAIAQPVDLAILATPAATIPELLEACVARGVRAALVVSAGFAEAGEEGSRLAEQIRRTAQANDMALLGPNCLGYIRPGQRLNASFARKMPQPGGIAFISQSGALCTAVLDWSVKEHVGFSYFVSIGEMVDIGFHDLIDYFGNNPETRAILIYMETLTQARQFMSAARGFARTKPIIVLKVGRSQEGAQAALFHTGSLTGTDQVFDAAFKRAGILRVESIAELFDCAKTLAMQRRPNGNRLAIITNAGGPGVIATDALIARQGSLASLSVETLRTLDENLPPFWSRGNPIDILGDADAARYRLALKACLKDRSVDGILAVLTPQAMTGAVEVAQEMVEISKGAYKTLLTAFMGEDDVADARRILEQGKIPAYETPEEAVRSFMNMVAYQRNLKLLTETPAAIPHAFTPRTQATRQILDTIAASGRRVLTYPEVKQILSNYDIPVPEGGLAQTPAAARALARRLGYPLVMKVVSPDIIYESEVGGIVSGIGSEAEIEPGFRQIMDSVRAKQPDARLAGVYLEPVIAKRQELLVGCKKDPIFGPAIVFGMGGAAADVFKDTRIGLPPLNMTLAQQLIDETRIAALLKGHRGAPGVDVAAIQFLLYKFAYLVMDFPEIKEIDLNPYAIDDQGGIVLDAKLILDESVAGKDVKPYAHMVISPYPSEYESTFRMKNGQEARLRPIRPEDEPIEAEMFAAFSEDTSRFRFMGPIKGATHELLIRYTQIDYDREIAIIAELSEDGRQKMAGVVRLIADPYNETAEYAIVVADPWQGQGLGTRMTETILEIAAQRGIKKVYAYVLEDNAGMLHLFKKFGFKFRKEKEMFYVEKRLEGSGGERIRTDC